MNLLVTEFESSARSDDELRWAASKLPLQSEYAAAFGSRILARPLFLAATTADRVGGDIAELVRIMDSLTDRCFGGDALRFATAAGIPEDLARLGATYRSPVVDPYARVDAYHDGIDFRFLEINVGSELGGIDGAALSDAYLQVPAFARFAQAHRLRSVDTIEVLLDHLARTVSKPASALRIALVEAPRRLVAHLQVFRAIQEHFDRHRVRLVLGEIHDIGEADGLAVVGGEPVDVVLRYFAVDEIVGDPEAVAGLDRLTRLHRNGGTVCFTTLGSSLLNSKGCLALLHDPAVQAVLSDAEIALIERRVPWSALLTPNASGPQGGNLSAYCRDHRGELVIKPTVGCSGTGVVVGAHVEGATWEAAVDRSLAEGHSIVQQLVVAAPESVTDPASGRIADWSANWGIFMVGGHFGGAFCRALQPDDGSVITFGNRGTATSCVFLYDDAPTGNL